MPTVLLIEDNLDLLELLAFNLHRSGFLVHTAVTAMEGLHEARRRLPDLIVLDILLPDLDGITTCEILRKQPSTAQIPVLMLTALSGHLTRFVGLEAGADDFMTKPIRPRDFLRRVANLLERKGQSPSEVDELNSERYGASASNGQAERFRRRSDS